TQLLEHPDAGARLRDRWFGLSPMGRERLEQVIIEPARARGVRYQDGLRSVRDFARKEWPFGQFG
ncbi:MAG TPA: hypothetical protein VGA04_34665, partial [Streptosporangiaceae bacterium]